jgi:hypothetical protein
MSTFCWTFTGGDVTLSASAHFTTPKLHTNATRLAKASPQDRAAVAAAVTLPLPLLLLLPPRESGAGRGVDWPLVVVERVWAWAKVDSQKATNFTSWSECMLAMKVRSTSSAATVCTYSTERKRDEKEVKLMTRRK